jgi:hypothetical protein
MTESPAPLVIDTTTAVARRRLFHALESTILLEFMYNFKPGTDCSGVLVELSI